MGLSVLVTWGCALTTFGQMCFRFWGSGGSTCRRGRWGGVGLRALRVRAEACRAMRGA